MAADGTGKLAIVGAGSVGAGIAHACALRRTSRQIALYDSNRDKAQAQALDLSQALDLGQSSSIEASDDLAVCAGADVVILAVGVRQKRDNSFAEMGAANVEIYRRVIPDLVRLAPQAAIVVTSSPVDALTYAALKLSGLESRRVMGIGTVAASAHFADLIARRLRISAQDVRACIAGESGDWMVPLWSSATAANIPLHQWAVAGHGKLTVRDRTEIFQTVKESARQIIAGKGAATFAIARAAAQIVQAVLNDESRVLTVTALLTDYQGISDVSLSVPRIVNHLGAQAALPVPMNEAEQAGLRQSADAVGSVVRQLGV